MVPCASLRHRGAAFFLTNLVKYMKDALCHELGECVVMTSERPGGAKSDAAGPSRGEAPIRIELADLLGGRREAIIVHNGADYRLRVTANGKLILTK